MTKIEVTDHAVIRWLERVEGINVDALRKVIAEQARPYVEVRARYGDLGGVWVVLNGPLVVTITPDKPRSRFSVRHDGEFANGTDAQGERLPWKAKARRREHK
ncbi:MAG: hypothetical protein ACRCXM_11525 [Beijerinckiaceae bacterium]